MRTSAFRPAALLFLALSAAACDDAPAVATPDMTMVVINDLSIAADMSTGPDLGGQTCLQVITCASGCGSNTACAQACAAAGSPAAQQKYRALFGCAYSHCLAPGDGGMSVDGGAGSCTSTMDTSMTCSSCVSTQAQSPACSQQLNDCLSG